MYGLPLDLNEPFGGNNVSVASSRSSCLYMARSISNKNVIQNKINTKTISSRLQFSARWLLWDAHWWRQKPFVFDWLGFRRTCCSRIIYLFGPLVGVCMRCNITNSSIKLTPSVLFATLPHLSTLSRLYLIFVSLNVHVQCSVIMFIK